MKPRRPACPSCGRPTDRIRFSPHGYIYGCSRCDTWLPRDKEVKK